MKCDDVSAARQAQGRFQYRHDGGAPPSRVMRTHAAWGEHAPRLRLHNHPAHLLVGALLLSTVRGANPACLLGVPSPVSTGGGAQRRDAAAGVLPSAQAQPEYQRLAAGQPASPCRGLTDIANGAVAACIAAPRWCGPALGFGAATAVAATMYCTARDAMTPAAPAVLGATSPAAGAVTPAHAALVEAVQNIHVAPTEGGTDEPLETVLLRIQHDCNGDLRCRANAINTVLERLPPNAVEQLMKILIPGQRALPTATDGTWPPMADAAPLFTGSELAALVDALGNLYSADQAAFQYYLERIVASTVSGGGSREGSPADIQQHWIDANTRRQATVAELLEREVGAVTWLPYAQSGLAHLGIADGTTAFNLHVILPTADRQPPLRRIMLVAHGDMIGRSLGSEGAVDNGSGVATAILIGSWFRENPPPAGTQVELLVTSNEELGFIGARAFVERCLPQRKCPDVVINVDMTGRGGRGYIMSGTEALAGWEQLGKPPLYLQAPPVSAVERQARQQLKQQFDAHGFAPAAAQAPPWVTSDQIPFGNVSIPAFGISQISPNDAHLWKQVEDARAQWHALDAQVDWTLWQAQRDGTAVMSANQALALKENHRAASNAYQAYRQLRDAHPNAPPVMIHSGGDVLHRVNPVMGVEFARALADGIRHLQWETDPIHDSPHPLAS